MEEFKIPEKAKINFQVICNPAGITIGCKDCMKPIHTKKYFIEVKIDDKPYSLSNSEEFKCPNCGADKFVTLVFDDDETAMKYVKDFIASNENKESFSIPLIDLNSGIRISGRGSKNAHLN
jgi:Zn finger protein HypA/HybF involved in hydrogenase expression